jgi:hypothetical protein
LHAWREEGDKASPLAVSNIIARDPLMTALLLRYLQSHKHRSQTNVVLEVEQALLMLGLEPFFNKVVSKISVEEMLSTQTPALIAALRVVHRSHRASSYAYYWAVRLLNLMDAENSQKPRVRNVVLADRLARHSAHGWDDAALPDDYSEIGGLLHMSVEDVMNIVGFEGSSA